MANEQHCTLTLLINCFSLAGAVSYFIFYCLITVSVRRQHRIKFYLYSIFHKVRRLALTVFHVFRLLLGVFRPLLVSSAVFCVIVRTETILLVLFKILKLQNLNSVLTGTSARACGSAIFIATNRTQNGRSTDKTKY